MSDTASSAALTASRQDYLANIYRIQGDGRTPNNGEVAQYRGVSPLDLSHVPKAGAGGPHHTVTLPPRPSGRGGSVCQVVVYWGDQTIST